MCKNCVVYKSSGSVDTGSTGFGVIILILRRLIFINYYSA